MNVKLVLKGLTGLFKLMYINQKLKYQSEKGFTKWSRSQIRLTLNNDNFGAIDNNREIKKYGFVIISYTWFRTFNCSLKTEHAQS
jgi:hypothetical protein